MFLLGGLVSRSVYKVHVVANTKLLIFVSASPLITYMSWTLKGVTDTIFRSKYKYKNIRFDFLVKKKTIFGLIFFWQIKIYLDPIF